MRAFWWRICLNSGRRVSTLPGLGQSGVNNWADSVADVITMDSFTAYGLRHLCCCCVVVGFFFFTHRKTVCTVSGSSLLRMFFFLRSQEDRLDSALTVDKSMDLEECQLIEQRFDGITQELNANEKRVEVVNDLGSQLIEKGHINSDEIRETTDRLNTRSAQLVSLSSSSLLW